MDTDGKVSSSVAVAQLSMTLPISVAYTAAIIVNEISAANNPTPSPMCEWYDQE